MRKANLLQAVHRLCNLAHHSGDRSADLHCVASSCLTALQALQSLADALQGSPHRVAEYAYLYHNHNLLLNMAAAVSQLKLLSHT